jgi:sulfide:quinone oxidoreductase
MANILILGGGFGGLIAAEKLAEAFGTTHQITLVSASRRFTFYPALVRLAFGDCEPEDITFDLTDKLNRLDVRFVEGEAIQIKPAQRRVQIAGKDFNGEINYDYLVIAFGRRLATEKIGGFFEYSHHLLGIKDALKFGEKLKTFRRGKIVVGMAPHASLPVPVCETAFALGNKFKKEIESGTISVQVVFPESVAQAFGGADIHRELEEAFEKHGIETVTNFAVREITEKTLVSEGDALDYDLLMFLPPFRGQASVGKLLDASDNSDFVMVDEFMRVKGMEKTYAVGDTVGFSGPKLAHMAVRQGATAAANIISEIRGNQPEKVYYHEIASIIDAGGTDSIYLHYGIWDETLYRLKKGNLWSWMKSVHDRLWMRVHEGV